MSLDPRATSGRRPRVTGLLGAVAGLVLGGAVLDACSSHSASPTTEPSSTSTSGGTAGTGVTSTTPATTTSTLAVSATCQASQLRVVPQQANGGAGTIELVVDLVNQGGSTCTLFGYPGMQLRDATGRDLPTNVVRGGGPAFDNPAANRGPSPVTVPPQRTAAFGLSYSDVPVGNETSCPASSSALITPPGDFSSATVSLAISPCDGGTVHVSPVYAAS